MAPVSCKLPDQEEPTDEVLLQLQEAFHPLFLICQGDFNHPNTCWKSSMVSCRQSRRVLKSIENNFLSQLIDSPARGDAILDLMVTNTSELISAV